jgi:phage terminase small subunit
MRKLSEKAAEFCRLIVYERESHARAYLHARYADTKNANVKAYQLLQKDYIQAEINRLNLVITAEKLVDRNLMTKKYFELAAVCNNEHDRPTQKGCLDSICKIYGLAIDVQAGGDGAMANLTDEQNKRASEILEFARSKYVNSPSQDAAGLTNSTQPDVIVPPEQVESAQ